MTTLPLHSARRLWQTFLSARILVAALLLVLLATQTWTATAHHPHTPWLWLCTTGYVLMALGGWIVLRHKTPERFWRWPWLLLLATDVLVICFLQEWQTGKMHYTPLLALPILTVAVLGQMRLALATTAGITLILLGIDVFHALRSDSLTGEHYMQTALLCAGFFAVAYLTHQLAQRLAQQELQTHAHQQAARMQALVNSAIIDHLAEGVVVVDHRYQVRMANPAACELLGLPAPLGLYDLCHPEWQALRALVDRTYASHQTLSQHIHLTTHGHHMMGLHVRTWLTARQDEVLPQPPALAPCTTIDLDTQAWLCVMFLHDLREEEAHIRTEKMAAMGRMSAAVAHEIRNPLAAIVQANALLAEDLNLPAQQRLCHMVEQNAQRLARIAEDVLDIARAQQHTPSTPSPALLLDAELQQIWHEWRIQHPQLLQGVFQPGCPQAHIAFDSDHLHRIVVNLLDNAARYCQAGHEDGLQLITGTDNATPWLQVWSNGAPLEASVHKHLFEPFFSSQSRSTGLGLYICRELCQRHGASIDYARCERLTTRGLEDGNAFTVRFRSHATASTTASLFEPNVV